MKKLTAWVTLLLLLSMAGACKPVPTAHVVPDGATTEPQVAPWLTTLIQQLQEEKPANPPARIYRYIYNNQEVYYLMGRCCDIPSKLFNLKGEVICAPDGGITGKGDGKCPDFFEKRTNETLIWEDKRES
jgi:hypothetical protein